jgi:hypothetical protein
LFAKDQKEVGLEIMAVIGISLVEVPNIVLLIGLDHNSYEK